MVKFFLLGEDNRINALKKIYSEEDKVINNIEFAEYIITPIPFSKDEKYITGTDIEIEEFAKMCINKKVISGAISKHNRRVLEINNVVYLDLMDLDEMAIQNAIPTAEGVVAEVIKETDFTIFHSNVLVMGYGRVGKIIARTFHAMGANVYCEARSEKDLAQIYAMGYNEVDLKNLDSYLGEMDVIINTIPQMMIDKKRLERIKQNSVIIDVSSSPGGVDFEEAKLLNIKAKLVLGIPSQVACVSAAIYMKKIIDKKIERGEL